MPKWNCRRCMFTTNTEIMMMKHAIEEHDAVFSLFQVYKVKCTDMELRNEILKLLSKKV